MSTDWVPLYGYDGDLNTIAASTEATFDLMDPDNWQVPGQFEGTIEDENRVYKVLRIVGYWNITAPVAAAPSRGHLAVRAWPGFQQHNLGTIIPGPLTSSGVTTTEIVGAANEKWWWERMKPWFDVDIEDSDRWGIAGGQNDPYCYMADFKPNMWMGDSFSPMVTVANYTDVTVTWRHRWRALVAY